MEEKEKQIFDETQEKQAKFIKKYLLFIFGGIGIVFTILAIIMFCFKFAVKELPIVFISVGIFILILGIILYFVIPTKYNYEKFKLRIEKYGFMNVYEMNAKIIELEERIQKLENSDK